MIEWDSGDMLARRDEFAMLVNPVNVMGVAGKGLARAFKDQWPERQEFYRYICESGLLKPGGFLADMVDDPWIGYFATKDHWKDDSKLEWIEEGSLTLRAFIEAYKPATVAVPPVGCGLGGLSWTDVKRILERNLQGLSCTVVIFQP